MAIESKIIIVELNEPHNGEIRWCFGSKVAIYQHLPAHIVGIALTTLQNKVKLVEPYSNDKCAMYMLTLHRAKTNRGNYKRRLK